MELKIAFTEQPKNSGAFVFGVNFNNENHVTDLPFTNPLAETDLKDLRWYLEDYLDWPFNPIIRERGDKIEAKLDEWGAALFRALFAGHVPNSEDRRLGRLLLQQHRSDRPLSGSRAAGSELRA